MWRSLRSVAACGVVWAVAACGAQDASVEGDPLGLTEIDPGTLSSDAALRCAVLRVAREAPAVVLDGEVKLDRRAANSIVTAREWMWLGSIETLDGLYYVGASALAKLANYARAHAEWACGAINVQLLATNDFHGNLKAPAGSSGRIVTGPDANVNRVDAGGVEFLATHMKTLEATNPNTVVVAAGDVIGATPLLSALFHDEPTVESMNLVGLDVAGVGNHEFDEGIDELWRMQYGGCHPADGCQDGDDFAGADYAYLAANVTETATGENVFAPYTIKTFRGARVAFIGMTLEGTPLVTTATGVAGLSFADEADTVNALIPELRAQGIEAIVVLLHEGGLATGLYNECKGISGPLFEIVGRFDAAVDVVVAGHTNQAHVCDVNGKLVTSAASFGRLITDIDLVVDEVTGDIIQKQAANVIVTRDVARDAALTTLIAKYDVLAAPIANRVIAKATTDLTKLANAAGESTMGAVIADAQLAATKAADRGGAQLALMNPGGIRTDIVMAQVAGGEQPGEITYGECFAVQPFSNNLVTLTLTGAQLAALLEQQWVRQADGTEKAAILAVSAGFSYTWDGAKPIGGRVSALALNGVALDPVASYRVTANVFLAGGGDGFSVFKQGTNLVGGAIDVDALESHLKAQSPVSAPALGRIKKLVAPAPAPATP